LPATRPLTLPHPLFTTTPLSLCLSQVLGGLLATPSPRLQMEVCLALEPLAAEHRVAMCQAQVVTALIALTHTPDDEWRRARGGY